MIAVGVVSVSLAVVSYLPPLICAMTKAATHTITNTALIKIPLKINPPLTPKFIFQIPYLTF
jgi:hypothetical protein